MSPIIEYLFKQSEKNYPEYQIHQIEYISNDNNRYRYRAEVSNSINPKTWMNWIDVELDLILRELRDEKIDIILD